MENEKIKRRISAAISRLLIQQPFFGTLLSSLEINKTSKFHTLATNGSEIFFNQDFIDKLNDDELRGVLLHEALHIAYLHCDPVRQIKTDHNLWNISCDLVINEEIAKDLKEKLPEGGVRCEFAHGMAAEEVLRSLEVKKHEQDDKDKTEKSESSDNNQQSQKGKSEAGIYEIWFNAQRGRHCLKQKIDGNLYDNLLPMDKNQKDELVTILLRAYDSACQMGDMRGSIPGSLYRTIESLRKPKIPWQRVLQRFVSTVLAREDYKFFPPNRRYITDEIWLPSLRSEKVGNLAVAIDTSASIGESDLDQFVSELSNIVGICDEVLVIICDCEIYSVEKVKNLKEIVTKIKFKGGGGTSHLPVFEEIKKRKSQVEGLICLTDGMTEYPEKAPLFPVLWCLTDFHFQPPWGESVVIPKNNQRQ